MGQKINPIGFRLPIRRDWRSRWFAAGKNYMSWVAEDFKIREFLQKKFKYASVQDILLERAGNRIRITILTGRPGVIIGRKGQELDKVKEQLQKLVKKDILLDVQELKKPDLVAQLIASAKFPVTLPTLAVSLAASARLSMGRLAPNLAYTPVRA